MKPLAMLLLVLATSAALAQPGRGRPHWPAEQRPQPPAQRPLAPEERERLQRDVRQAESDYRRMPPRPAPRPAPRDEHERRR